MQTYFVHQRGRGWRTQCSTLRVVAIDRPRACLKLSERVLGASGDGPEHSTDIRQEERGRIRRLGEEDPNFLIRTLHLRSGPTNKYSAILLIRRIRVTLQ
jgi:hypothetical protein